MDIVILFSKFLTYPFFYFSWMKKESKNASHNDLRLVVLNSLKRPSLTLHTLRNIIRNKHMIYFCLNVFRYWNQIFFLFKTVSWIEVMEKTTLLFCVWFCWSYFILFHLEIGPDHVGLYFIVLLWPILLLFYIFIF